MKKRIMSACIIDDDDIYVFGVKKLIKLKQLCDNITIFTNGREALNYLKPILKTPSLLPEIILLDINMPEMDGWEFVEEFGKLDSEITKNVSIYMVSSSANDDDMKRAKQIKAVSNYIIKPITLDLLADIFENSAA